MQLKIRRANIKVNCFVLVIINISVQLFIKPNQFLYSQKKAMSQPPNKKARQNRSDQIDFLRDFDLLTAIGRDQQSLYNPADIEIGESQMSSTYVLKKDNTKYKMTDHINQFMHFGPGIYLLFKFLKNLTVVFGLVSLFALGSIIVLVSGRQPRQSAITNQMKLGILKTTVYNLTSEDFGWFVGLNFIITLLLSIFLIYWSEKQKQYVIQCLKAAPLASYSTIIIKKLPENYSEQWLQIFMATKFGEIQQIYTVRNFGDDILEYKQMTEIVQEYKQQKVLIQLQPQRKSHTLANLFFQFRNGHLKMKQKIKDSQNYKPGFAFVQFKRVEDRQKLLEMCNKINFLFCFRDQNNVKQEQQEQNEENLRFKLSQMQITQCEMQPKGILWQNLHLTRTNEIIKISVMIFLVILVLSLSIFLIFLLSSVQMSVMNSKYKDESRQKILNMKDNFALLSYCINLSLSQFYQQSDICSIYSSQYIKLTIMIFMIPLSISLFKLVLTEIMKALVTFRRYAYEIKKIQSQSTIIFVFYFLVTGVLQLLIYLGSESTSVFEIFTPLIQAIVHSDFKPEKITLFSDYVPNWYLTASYNVIMIGAISFNLSGIGIIFYCKLRKRIFKRFALRQKIQIKMNSWLTGYVLQIQYVYAALLTIVYFTLLFGSTMPLLYLLAFLSFLILFFSYKYVFINFCAKPLTYNHSINRRVRKMLFGALIMQCFITPIFYGAPKIAQFDGYTGFFERLGSLWYYTLLMSLLICYVLFEKKGRILIAALVQYLKSRHAKKKQTLGSDSPLPNHINRKNFALPTIVRKKHNQLQLQSYSMHENLQYKDTLRTLYTINNRERARKTCVLNKQLLHLYEDNIKTSENQDSNNYRTLVEVIKIVRRDFKNYKTRHGKGRNPYGKTKRKLYEIFQHSKKGQCHKYTLCMNGSNGFSELFNSDGFASVTGDHIVQNSNQRDDQLKFQMDSNGRTKENFMANSSNLEQVIQAASFLEDDQENEEKKNKDKTENPKLKSKYFPRQSIKHQEDPLPIKKIKRVKNEHQDSNKSLNSSKI